MRPVLQDSRTKPQKQPKGVKRPYGQISKRSMPDPKKLQVLEWIEKLIVPELVQMYLENSNIRGEAARG